MRAEHLKNSGLTGSGTAASVAVASPATARARRWSSCGIWIDGWQPANVPVKYGVDEYRLPFAREAGIGIEGVDSAIGVVTAALHARLAPGQLDQLPISSAGCCSRGLRQWLPASSHVTTGDKRQDLGLCAPIVARARM